jgi:acetyl-CoA synthetase
MTSDSYAEAFASFDWKRVFQALEWNPSEKVSLGYSIVDRHIERSCPALLVVGKDGEARSYSYKELSEASNRFANLLRQLGVKPGDRVGGFLPRGAEVLVAIIGTLKAGAIYVPIFTGFGVDAIAFRLEHCSATVLVTHQSVAERLPPDIELRTVCVTNGASALPEGWLDFHPELEKQSPQASSELRDRNDVCTLIYTSGSTGPPKGGAIAVNFLAAIWPYIVYGLGLRANDVFWPTGDPGWGYGFVCYLGALAAGGTIVSVESNPTAEVCLSVLQRYQVTNLATTPTLLRSLVALGDERLRSERASLRAISSCGEPLNSKVVDTFQTLWDVTPMDHFGATEFAIPVGNFNAIAMAVKPGSMGRVFPGFQIAVVDDQGSEHGADTIGLIAKKTDENCRYWVKYWNDPAGTHDLVSTGWIVTGDLGRKDREGYFWFEGRVGDMIKSAGYRIGPFEIESALLKHPAVAEAAVVGKPDALRGEIVKAFVVLRSGIAASDELAEQLSVFVRDAVGAHQYPRIIEFVDTLPKTETGKIQRFALRARA